MKSAQCFQTANERESKRNEDLKSGFLKESSDRRSGKGPPNGGQRSDNFRE